MHSQRIQQLINAVESSFGVIEYYGSSASELHGVGFKLKGISASFSVTTLKGDLSTTYDIQVEGIPAGDYFYADEVNLTEFIELISKYEGSEAQWP